MLWSGYVVPMSIRSRPTSSFALEKLISAGENRLNPLSRRFSPQALQEAAEAAGLSATHQDVIDFGIAISGWITALDQRRRSHPFQSAHPADRAKFMLVLAMAETWRVRRDAHAQLSAAAHGAIRSTVDAVETLRHGLKLRSAELTESIIDSFAYIVIDSLADLTKPKTGYSHIADLSKLNPDDFADYINFSTTYRTMLELWQSVLYRSLEVNREADGWSISVPQDRATRAAVGETRKYQQMVSEITSELRKGGGADAAPIRLPTIVPTEFELVGEVWTFASKSPDTAKGSERKREMARMKCALHSWTAELAEEPIQPSGVRCLDLMAVWFAIRELAVCFIDEGVAAEDAPPPWPLTLDRQFLQDHLTHALEMREDIVSSCLKLLEHDGGLLTELYGHPLINLDRDQITIFVPGLIEADYERVLVRWLARYLDTKQEDSTYSRKGSIYECRARANLTSAVERAIFPAAWNIEPKAVRFKAKKGRKEREFDLLLTFGSYLLVGDVKCSSHPADPREIADRENLIDEAVRQVKEQVSWIRNNWRVFRSSVTLSLLESANDCNIMPFVLLDGCYGSGFPVDEVPILDGVELTQFITSTHWPPAGGDRVEIYRDLEQSQRVLPFYLSCPPIVQIGIAGTKKRLLEFSDPLIPAPIRYQDRTLPLHISDQDLRDTLAAITERYRPGAAAPRD
jgi:hypothetical protein